MENPTKISVAGSLRFGIEQDSDAPAVNEGRLAQAAHAEIRLMGTSRVNLLLAGTDAVVQQVLGTLSPNLQEPITSWYPGEPFVLPHVDHARTIVLHEVGALGLQEQIRLLEWLGGAVGRTQVVSTTSLPLLPRVQAGTFIDTLYYRLNTVFVDTMDVVEEPPPARAR